MKIDTPLLRVRDGAGLVARKIECGSGEANLADDGQQRGDNSQSPHKAVE